MEIKKFAADDPAEFFAPQVGAALAANGQFGAARG
jgi:hypothetical protein